MFMHQLALMLAHFFFHDTAATEIYTLSLHDALPICKSGLMEGGQERGQRLKMVFLKRPTCGKLGAAFAKLGVERADRKSTRLNSSHSQISYAVFCLKKKRRRPSSARARRTRRRTYAK